MKTMLSVLMMSCAVFADSQPAAEVQKGAESVLAVYSRMFGQPSEPLDQRLISVFVAGDLDATSGRPSVTIFMVGKTMFVAASKGQGVVVSPVCGRENIIKLADSLARPLAINSEFIRKHGTGMTSVPTCGESKLRIFQYAGIDFDPIVAPVYLEVTSKIGNIGEIDVRIPIKTAKGMSVAIRNYIPPSGGILDVSELLVSTHAKAIKAMNSAKALRQQGKYDDSLEILHQANRAISETMKSIPGALGLMFVRAIVVMEAVLVEKEKGDYPKTDPSAFEMAATSALADALKQSDSPEFMADMKEKIAIAVKKAKDAHRQAAAVWRTSIRLLLPQLSSGGNKVIDLITEDPPDTAEVVRMRDSGEVSSHELILIEGVLTGMQMDRFVGESWDWEAWAMTYIRNPSASEKMDRDE